MVLVDQPGELEEALSVGSSRLLEALVELVGLLLVDGRLSGRGQQRGAGGRSREVDLVVALERLGEHTPSASTAGSPRASVTGLNLQHAGHRKCAPSRRGSDGRATSRPRSPQSA
jgi:hypothetical protein